MPPAQSACAACAGVKSRSSVQSDNTYLAGFDSSAVEIVVLAHKLIQHGFRILAGGQKLQPAKTVFRIRFNWVAIAPTAACA
jgi:hypothetical protein